MEKINHRPLPTGWKKTIIKWKDIQNPPYYPIKEILDWVDEYDGGRYHLQGYKATQGFEFRFENPHDAILFRLKWL
jgi:hypothetical protein